MLFRSDPVKAGDFEELELENDINNTQTRPLYDSRIPVFTTENKSEKDLPESLNDSNRGILNQRINTTSNENFEKRLAKYLKPIPKISLAEKQNKLRKSLQIKGFINQEYIDMRVLELDDSIAEDALERADSLYEKGDIGEAIEVLKLAYTKTDFKNYLIRGMLSQKIMQLALLGAFPDQYINYLRQNLAVQSKVNSIKMETILMQNPIARERLLEEKKSIDQFRQNPEDAANAMAGMKRNKGLSQNHWLLLKASTVNAARNSDEKNAADTMNKNFKFFQNKISDAWSNPKE